MFVSAPDDGDQAPTGDGPDAGGGAGAPSPADMPGAETGIPQGRYTGDDTSRDDTGTDWQAKYEAVRKESRKWENRAKGNRTAQDQLDAIVKALNPDAEGGKPDPQELADDLAKARTAQSEAAAELAVYKAAAQAGADADSLLDSRRFMARISDLEPTADDYGEQVAAVVADTAATKTPPARTGRAGNEHSGGHATPEMDPAKLADAANRGGRGVKLF